MRDLSDKHRSDSDFAVGDYVHLKLQLYRHFSVAVKPFNKLPVKYFGPYPIDAVAYRLMPADV